MIAPPRDPVEWGRLAGRAPRARPSWRDPSGPAFVGVVQGPAPPGDAECFFVTAQDITGAEIVGGAWGLSPRNGVAAFAVRGRPVASEYLVVDRVAHRWVAEPGRWDSGIKLCVVCQCCLRIAVLVEVLDPDTGDVLASATIAADGIDEFCWPLPDGRTYNVRYSSPYMAAPVAYSMDVRRPILLLDSTLYVCCSRCPDEDGYDVPLPRTLELLDGPATVGLEYSDADAVWKGCRVAPADIPYFPREWLVIRYRYACIGGGPSGADPIVTRDCQLVDCSFAAPGEVPTCAEVPPDCGTLTPCEERFWPSASPSCPTYSEAFARVAGSCRSSCGSTTLLVQLP
jgi:hypothetical protein